MDNYVRKEKDEFSGIFYYNDKDQYHRLDGPAVEWYDGDKAWYIDGKRHRLDGPAVEYANENKYWFINGQSLTEEEFNKHPLVIERMLGKIIGEVLSED